MVRAMARGGVFVLVLLVAASGCTRRVYFTAPLRDAFEAGLESGPPRHPGSSLQYFVSDRIVLEREVVSRADRISSGRIAVRRGRMVERVIIRRGTPGIAEAWGEDAVTVSFEQGSNLVFERVPPPEEAIGKRSFAASFGVPNDAYRLRVSAESPGRHVAAFRGQPWEVTSGEAAGLMVRRQSTTRHRYRHRVLRGRRL